jgi:hypothetical protein
MTTLTNVAIDVVKRVGAARAKDGTHPTMPPIPNKTGYEGVDLPAGSRKYRARIRFNDSLSGRAVLINLGRYDNAEDAGYAYKTAHVAVWGALSYFVGEVTVEMIEAARAAGLADSTYAARGDNDGLI